MNDYPMDYNDNIDNEEIPNIPQEQNNDDIQDLGFYPRDSFVDHTPNNFINPSFGYTSTPFQNMQPFSNNNINKYNPQDTPDDAYDQGYSSYGISRNSYLYKHASKYENPNFKIDKSKMSKKSKNKTQNNNYSYKMPRPENEPIPQDTIIEDEQKEEETEGNNNINFQNGKAYDIEKLLEICRKNGTPPPDGDFSLEGWKLFYPPDEKFFLWEKGKTIPNQLIVNNENDEDKLEIYEGEINDKGERHGFGILTTPKYVRKGTWRDGEFTGWCRESRINGDIFEGKFIDGAIYGKGINKTHKGNLYVGDFVDNKREGSGELKTKRIHYDGDFKYDKFNGKGKIEFVQEGHSYEGDFKNNEISGVGIFKWNNGDIYEGEMTNGKMNGYGKYTYANGQIYEGNYVKGVKEGLGKLIYPNNKIYDGEFKNGKPQGEGTIYFEGKKVNIEFKDGKFHKK